MRTSTRNERPFAGYSNPGSFHWFIKSLGFINIPNHIVCCHMHYIVYFKCFLTIYFELCYTLNLFVKHWQNISTFHLWQRHNKWRWQFYQVLQPQLQFVNHIYIKLWNEDLIHILNVTKSVPNTKLLYSIFSNLCLNKGFTFILCCHHISVWNSQLLSER